MPFGFVTDNVIGSRPFFNLTVREDKREMSIGPQDCGWLKRISDVHAGKPLNTLAARKEGKIGFQRFDRLE
jgi:hypothetical protein